MIPKSAASAASKAPNQKKIKQREWKKKHRCKGTTTSCLKIHRLHCGKETLRTLQQASGALKMGYQPGGDTEEILAMIALLATVQFCVPSCHFDKRNSYHDLSVDEPYWKHLQDVGTAFWLNISLSICSQIPLHFYNPDFYHKTLGSYPKQELLHWELLLILQVRELRLREVRQACSRPVKACSHLCLHPNLFQLHHNSTKKVIDKFKLQSGAV